MKTGILLVVLGLALLLAAIGLGLYFRHHPLADPSEDDFPGPESLPAPKGPPGTSSSVSSPGCEKTELLSGEENA